MNKVLSEKLKLLPSLPGCYLYHDSEAEIIYIGKAKNLKKRVKSYFNKNHDSAKLNVMVPQIENLEYIITNSEAEALILESHLIKKHKPKYNILLKDDKKYPYFLITDEDFPRIVVTRKKNLNLEKGRYYGPYTDVRAMWATLDFLKKIFPLKQCKTPKFKNRPCLYYQIGRCMAPCQGLVTPEEYQKLIEQVELFLKGRQSELLKYLMAQIQEYSNKQEYEKAARLRDSYLDLQKTLERQKVVFENTKLNEDIISLLYEDGVVAIVILMIREGRLIDKKDFSYFVELKKDDKSETAEFMETFFREYYSNLALEFPDKIVSRDLEMLGEKEMYQEWLELLSKKKIKINYAKTKQGEELQSLADKNARVLLNNAKIEKMAKIRDDFNEIGAFLTEKLKLKNFPHRIECYDISHIQGTNTVASMVTFVNGVPKKSAYKKFRIKWTEEGKPDDFLSMKEVLTRRLNRLGEEGWEKPDLIIIDGGKGQLSSVMQIVNEFEKDAESKANASLQGERFANDATIQKSDADMMLKQVQHDMHLGIDFVSLAKREEEVFLPNNPKSIMLPRNSSALFLFQRIRDEAHRFAITYHRKLRSKELTDKSSNSNKIK